MRVGIYTRYFSHEATYAAIRLAVWAEQHGCEVTLFADVQRPGQISPEWDHRVLYAGPRGFTDWARDLDAIIWTHGPPTPQVNWCNSQQIKTILLPLWHELRPSSAKAFQAARCVVAPSREAATALKRLWKLSRCLPGVWDVGLPFTRKFSLQAPDRLSLLVPVLDAPGPPDGLLELLDAMLARHGHVSVTLAYTPSRWRPCVRRQLQRLTEQYDQRLRTVKREAWRRQPLLFAEHDLTVWPTLAENTGRVGLMSLCMGTPVIAFNCQPLPEFLTVNNAVLVPCQPSFTSLGVPTATPRFDRFGEYLYGLLASCDTVLKLQRGVMHNLDSRQRIFNESWLQALGC